MPRAVNPVFRMFLVAGLLLAPQADCMRADESVSLSHAHSSGEACHDDGAATDSRHGHAAHDDGAAGADCPVSHGCPTMTAIAPSPLAASATLAFARAPHATSRSLASITPSPDRRPPKA